jgi:hypothetical protein
MGAMRRWSRFKLQRTSLALGAWSLKDPLTKVNEFLLPHKPRIEEVNVDLIGVGHNFVPRLQSLGYPCNEVNVRTATQFPDQFANLKAQLYWKLRELFQDGAIHGLNDEVAISQLASIKWKANLRGLTALRYEEFHVVPHARRCLSLYGDSNTAGLAYFLRLRFDAAI